jgi:hypothetical protein
MEKFDILILVGNKDINKIKFVYDSILKNICGFNKIYCICENIPLNKINGIEYYCDNDILHDYNLNLFKGKVKDRINWYKQQYIKILQNITIDNYLVIDSDIIINKKIDIFSENKPCFFIGRNQFHKPYFIFINKLLNINKVYNKSFISEIMYFKRNIINDILKSIDVDHKEFFNKSVKILNDMNEDSGMSEYEMYGNYVVKNYNNIYNFKTIKTHLGGKYSTWSDNEILRYVNNFKNEDFDIISMHSWM